MQENAPPMQVEITSGLPGPAPITGDVMVFSTFSVLFCGNILGWFGGSATFTIGVLQLSLAGLFFVGARERCKYATFWGNMNLIFAFYFGVLGGATNVLAGLNVGLDGTVLAIPNLIAGAVLCGTLPGARRDPWTFFVLYVLAAIAVLFLGLGGLGILAGVLYPVAAVCLGGVGVLGTYAVICNVNGCSGVNMPYGRPLFK